MRHFYANSSSACRIALGFYLLVVSMAQAKPPAPLQEAADIVDARTFTFKNAELKRVFEQFSASLPLSVERTWLHQPFRNVIAPTATWYAAEWNKRVLVFDGRGYLEPPNHFIQLGAAPGVSSKDITLIQIVEVTGAHMPVEGWGARCGFLTNGPAETDTLELNLHHCPAGRPCGEAIRLSGAACHGGVGFDGHIHRFSASAPSVKGEKRIRLFLETPEGFLKQALAEQDHLEAAVRNSAAKGELVRFIERAGRGRSRQPREGLQPLSEVQNEEILRTALAIVERQRRMIRKDYRELHAAAIATFPLLECLQKAARPQSE